MMTEMIEDKTSYSESSDLGTKITGERGREERRGWRQHDKILPIISINIHGVRPSKEKKPHTLLTTNIQR